MPVCHFGDFVWCVNQLNFHWLNLNLSLNLQLHTAVFRVTSVLVDLSYFHFSSAWWRYKLVLMMMAMVLTR